MTFLRDQQITLLNSPIQKQTNGDPPSQCNSRFEILETRGMQVYSCDNRRFLKIKVGQNSNKYITFLLDSGAMCSIIKSDEIDKIKIVKTKLVHCQINLN